MADWPGNARDGGTWSRTVPDPWAEPTPPGPVVPDAPARPPAGPPIHPGGPAAHPNGLPVRPDGGGARRGSRPASAKRTPAVTDFGMPADDPFGFAPPPAPPPESRLRRLVRDHRAGFAGLLCALGMVAVGPLLGLVWALLAPRFDLSAGLAGAESAFAVQSSIDVCFGVVCAVGGALAGVLAFWRAAGAGWPVPVGLAVGGVIGARIAGRVGHAIRSPELMEALPEHASDLLVSLVDFQVRAEGLYLVLPGAALVVLAVLLWLTMAVPGVGRGRRD